MEKSFRPFHWETCRTVSCVDSQTWAPSQPRRALIPGPLPDSRLRPVKVGLRNRHFEENPSGPCKASAEKKRASRAVRQEKGNLLEGKEGDRPWRRTSVLPFWRSPSYTPPMTNPLKAWSRSQRSGIWWSRSFEKIGTSEITGCHLGNLVNLKDHCDLFFICEVDITSHRISETPCGPYQLDVLWWWEKKKKITKVSTFAHVRLGQ